MTRSVKQKWPVQTMGLGPRLAGGISSSTKFPSFFEDIQKQLDDKIPEKTKRKAFAVSSIIEAQTF